MAHHLRKNCRACNGTDLHRFLELGPQPLANALPKSPEEFKDEAFYPLDVYFCKSCSLVQILDVIDPSVLFSHYIYLTGTSTTIAEHNVRYAQAVVDELNLSAESMVMEIASNDGSLLKKFQPHGVKTLGIEPATNIAKIARDAGVETVNEFFSLETAKAIRESHGPADAIIGNNVLAHVDETRDFMSGARHIIKPDGRAIFEFPYLGEFMDRLEYDTVYHEHMCYFSVTAIMRLGDEIGLRLQKVDHMPVHGGSIRAWFGSDETFSDHSDEVKAIAAKEAEQGLTTVDRYVEFADGVKANRTALLELLNKLKAEGKTVAGYGAPAKGNTLLNYCGISTDLVPYTVDRSPLKVNLYLPGVHIPVLPAETILEKQPDYVLILAWNFAEEIMGQQQEYKDRGGQFIIPLPEPKIV